ncbi:type II secretion system minor pseudopilin [Desulfobacula toluolica]|uniref:GspK: type II secretoy pathway component PulK-like protein n=1 Tax=Desulfobacula toluolica (strain DSM 7467 / Tol2) TaxID=651182 RepID=K0NIF6_DESTT|nr:type II secretion system protein GspK [Desulfobacula toluolica]CCK79543.1 GspK: type II secretoy pathway component PulK-like protein [Desulfobacula toluolica Tol2]
MNRKTLVKILKNENGVALLITLSIIAILLTISLELNRRVKIGSMAAQTGKDDYYLMEMAESGINVAKAVLVKDTTHNRIDSVQEEWADTEILDKIIHSLAFDEGDIKLKINDEMGKLQINALIDTYPGHEVNQDQKQICENLLSFFISNDKSEDKRDPRQITNCLIDWLDSKDGEMITGISGAESSFYESLTPPYKCANREFFDLNEMFFVKGVSNTLLSESDNLNSLFFDQKDLQLNDLFTVFGAEKNKNDKNKHYQFSGKININTAPIQVIAAILPFGKKDLAKNISEYRCMKPDDKSGYANDLSVKNWYAGVAGLTQKETEQIAKIVTYSSDIFSIESHAILKGKSLVLKSVVKRQKDKNGKWFCKTLRQQID